MSEQYKKLIKDIQTYPNMNEHIKKILSFSLGNFEAYTLARIIELEEQVEIYKQALEFYADSKNWLPQNDDVLSEITMDYGSKAQQALRGVEEK